VHLNFVQRDYRRACQIIGSEGTIYWDFQARRVDVFGPDGELARSIPEPAGWQVNQMYVDELTHFLQAVERGTPTINPISGGWAALQIALAAKEAKHP
jgi:predicted dehydrogenase